MRKPPTVAGDSAPRRPPRFFDNPRGATYHDRGGGGRRVRVLCTGRIRTSSGPEGSSDKDFAPGAADQPEPFVGHRRSSSLTRSPFPSGRATPPAMAYQALARKWRPQDFSSLVGQEAVVQALRNALSENRVAQAYLFCGIRG